ncbi:hypothetical protein BKA70DRAFT_1451711 [Coprinopsis sp. MPI-PUGE-AT-0042]|nr:hypothetical protein BKA70DRAFT_1451711 [Coprinopsis sp. MPI-PUGE-AT-0042]
MPQRASFKKIAGQIRGGSVECMEHVLQNWPPSGTPVAIFDAIQPHFSIPDHDAIEGVDMEGYAEWSLTKRRARLASLTLIRLLKPDAPFHSPQSRLTLTERVIANLDSIVWWETELVTNNGKDDPVEDQGKQIGAFLSAMINFTEALASATKMSPSAVELVAIAYLAEHTNEHLMEHPIDH